MLGHLSTTGGEECSLLVLKWKEKKEHETEREDHTHTHTTEEPEMRFEQETITNLEIKPENYWKYKRISCMHLCSVPLPTKFDIKTFELALSAQRWVCCDLRFGSIWSE